MSKSSELIITNARIVTPKNNFLGTVQVRDGTICTVDTERSRIPGALDLDGDFLLPGLVELHTDLIEQHVIPRRGVRWPTRSAFYAHDAQAAASGVTTVLDAVALGASHPENPRFLIDRDVVATIRSENARGLSKAEHMLHLRCEVSYEHVTELFEEQSRGGLVKLVSIMDHTPGQRQFADINKYRNYIASKYGLSDRASTDFIALRQAAHDSYSELHRRSIISICRERRFALATHDDTTADHVEEAIQAGAVISEFPTTFEAARQAHEHGLSVLMGGPNIVMGKSHAGNVSAMAIAEFGLLDIISSDYVLGSLLQSAFVLAVGNIGISLPDAVNKISLNPARAVGLNDRGAIEPGRRADLVWVALTSRSEPLVRRVWRHGCRVI